jgi:hypothetical protein
MHIYNFFPFVVCTFLMWSDVQGGLMLFAEFSQYFTWEYDLSKTKELTF